MLSRRPPYHETPIGSSVGRRTPKLRENDRIDACVVRRGFTQQALLQTPFKPIREGAARLRHWNMRHWKESSALFVPRFERFELLCRDFRGQPETQQRAAADLGDVLVTAVGHDDHANVTIRREPDIG